MTTGAAEGRVEIPGAIPEGSGQKPREAGSGAANVTGRKATHWPEAATGLMEKISQSRQHDGGILPGSSQQGSARRR